MIIVCHILFLKTTYTSTGFVTQCIAHLIGTVFKRRTITHKIELHI